MTARRILASAALLLLVALSPGWVSAAARSASSKVTITYWTHVNQPAQILERKLIARFEKLHPDIAVNYLPVTFNDLPTKLTTALAGGAGPDIFNYFRSYAPALVQHGFIAPVDVKAFGVSNRAAFDARYLPSVVNGFTFGGTVYGVPHEVSNFAFWINTAMFKAAGLNPTTNFPRTWDDVARLGQKLTIRKNGKIVREGLSLPMYNVVRNTLVLDFMTRQAGGKLFSDDGKKAYLNSPAAIKALQTWASFVHVNRINDPALGPTASTDNLDLFGNGTAAMTNVGGSWFISILQQQYPKVYQSYMVGPEPHFAGGPNVGADLYGFGLFVSKSSAHQAQAWQFARFLADNGDAYFTDAGIWLGGKATLNSSVTSKLPHWSLFKATFAQGNFLPPVLQYTQISTIVERAIERSVLNGQSARQSLDQAQQEVQPLMQ